MTPVRLAHLVELREALVEAYATAERTAARWTECRTGVGCAPYPGGAPDGVARRGGGAGVRRAGEDCESGGIRIGNPGTGTKTVLVGGVFVSESSMPVCRGRNLGLSDEGDMFTDVARRRRSGTIRPPGTAAAGDDLRALPPLFQSVYTAGSADEPAAATQRRSGAACR